MPSRASPSASRRTTMATRRQPRARVWLGCRKRRCSARRQEPATRTRHPSEARAVGEGSHGRRSTCTGGGIWPKDARAWRRARSVRSTHRPRSRRSWRRPSAGCARTICVGVRAAFGSSSPGTGSRRRRPRRSTRRFGATILSPRSRRERGRRASASSARRRMTSGRSTRPGPARLRAGGLDRRLPGRPRSLLARWAAACSP